MQHMVSLVQLGVLRSVCAGGVLHCYWNVTFGRSRGNMFAFREKWYGSNWLSRRRLRSFDSGTQNSPMISLVLLHVSPATAAIMASSCPGVRTAYRRPAWTGAVIVTFPVSQRHWYHLCFSTYLLPQLQLWHLHVLVFVLPTGDLHWQMPSLLLFLSHNDAVAIVGKH